MARISFQLLGLLPAFGPKGLGSGGMFGAFFWSCCGEGPYRGPHMDGLIEAANPKRAKSGTPSKDLVP